MDNQSGKDMVNSVTDTKDLSNLSNVSRRDLEALVHGMKREIDLLKTSLINLEEDKNECEKDILKLHGTIAIQRVEIENLNKSKQQMLNLQKKALKQHTDLCTKLIQKTKEENINQINQLLQKCSYQNKHLKQLQDQHSIKIIQCHQVIDLIDQFQQFASKITGK